MREKSLLVLGASSDIGRAIARIFAKNNYRIFLAARDTKRILPDCQDLNIRYGTNASAHSFDACAFHTHQEFVDQFDQVPSIVCCVFGYLGEQSLAQQDWEEAEKIMATNYMGAVSLLEKFALRMEQEKRGTLIGISSVAGERGRQSNYMYGSAKAGFSAYLSGLRHRLFAHGVHVLSVKPGFVDTQMTEGMNLPPLLTAKPQEVAKAVYKAVRKKKNTIYVKWMWRYIMWIIRLLPEPVFKKTQL